jgi:hypothetical protein
MIHLTVFFLMDGIELFLLLLIWSLDAGVYPINTFASIHWVISHVMLAAPLRRVSLVAFDR